MNITDLLSDQYKISEREEKFLMTAFDLFTTFGIDEVSMETIAEKTKVSSEEFYRMFPSKPMLAVRTATWAWEKRMEDVLPSLLKPKYTNSKGYEQLEVIFSLFVKLYEKHNDFLRFIYLFDSYAVKEKIPKTSMVQYEAVILLVKQIISEAIEKGIADGSINEKYTKYGELLYFTLMHTFFSAAQKLSLSGKMLDMDSKMNGSIQLKLLSDILLSGLK